MKTKTKILSFSAFLMLFLGLSAHSSQAQDQDGAAVAVYYFHFNTRCETCRAVESEAKMDVQELFLGDVSFAAYNLDEAAGEAKGKEIGVNSQMLVVVKGDQKIDLTNEGFLYARTDPDKFREIIEKKIKPLL